MRGTITVENKSFSVPERTPAEIPDNLYKILGRISVKKNLGATALGKLPVRTLVQLSGRILEKNRVKTLKDELICNKKNSINPCRNRSVLESVGLPIAP